MRRNQLPPHPVVSLMFLVNTLYQSSLRKITRHPDIMIFLSGPPLFFFSKNFKNCTIPAFFFFFFLFCFVLFYYCFASTSGGPHQQEVSPFSSLFYSRKTGSWKMRDSMGLTNWIILRITGGNLQSNS